MLDEVFSWSWCSAIQCNYILCNQLRPNSGGLWFPTTTSNGSWCFWWSYPTSTGAYPITYTSCPEYCFPLYHGGSRATVSPNILFHCWSDIIETAPLVSSSIFTGARNIDREMYVISFSLSSCNSLYGHVLLLFCCWVWLFNSVLVSIWWCSYLLLTYCLQMTLFPRLIAGHLLKAAFVCCMPHFPNVKHLILYLTLCISLWGDTVVSCWWPV